MGNERRPARGGWVIAGFYLALIHAASSASPGEMGLTIPAGLDKLVHLCEFGVLAVLFWRPLRETAVGRPEVRAAAVLFVFVAANGLIDEFHQSFVPGREPSLMDSAADMLGGGLAIYWLLHREKGRTQYTGATPGRGTGNAQ
ncbi:MAG: VanZ family protein [Nitrospinota bacterium]